MHGVLSARCHSEPPNESGVTPEESGESRGSGPWGRRRRARVQRGVGVRAEVGAGCQGGPLGHEIKKKMQGDTGKINRKKGLPGLV